MKSLNLLILSFYICDSLIGSLEFKPKPPLFELNLTHTIAKAKLLWLNNIIGKDNFYNETDLLQELATGSEYSFTTFNNFGDYKGCLEKKLDYYFLIFLKLDQNTTDKDLFQTTLDLNKYFHRLVFADYFSLSLCLPQTYHFIGNNFTTVINNHNYSIIHYKTGGEFKKDYYWSNLFMKLFMIVMITIAVIATLFTSSKHIKIFSLCCKFKDQKKNDSISDNQNSRSQMMLSSPKSSNKGVKSNYSHVHSLSLYHKLVFFFNLERNINRLFEINHTKPSTHSIYICDNSLGFINGLRGLAMILISSTQIIWIYFVSLVSNTNSNLAFEQIFKSSFKISIFSLGLNMYYVFYALNAFTLGYKFLYHMNHSDGIDTSTTRNKLRLATRFFLIHTYRYVLYLLILSMLTNLEKVFNLSKGPLYFIYYEISSKIFENIVYFILPITNFYVDKCSLKHQYIIYYLIMFVIEIQYFLITIILLFIYSCKSNIGSKIFICAIAISLLVKSAYNILGEATASMIFSYEIQTISFFKGFPSYLMGTICGIIYYEFNYQKSDDIDLLSRMSIGNEHEKTHKGLVTLMDERSLEEKKNKSINDNTVFNNKTHKTTNSPKHDKGIFQKLAMDLIENKDLLKFFLILVFIIFIFLKILDEFLLFSNFKNDVLYQMSTFEKFYFFLEIECIIAFVFVMIFKYVIYSKSIIKDFLEMNMWVYLSRSAIKSLAFLTPFLYFFFLDSYSPLSMSYINMILSMSTILVFIVLGVVLFSLVIYELPLKTMFKYYSWKILICKE